MTMKSVQAVLFDLDGTILDTNELIIQSFLYALKSHVPPEFGREQMIPSMGLPLAHQLQLFSGLSDVDELIHVYRAKNLELHDELVTAFPYVREVLELLQAAGIRMGVVTTKMRMTTELGLKHVGIREYMSAIVTLDDVTHAKPHPEPVEQAVRLLGCDPAATLMVGDSGVDMLSAAAAGVVPVGVSWSLKGEGKLLEAGAAHIIHDMRELLPLVGLEQQARA